MVEPVSIVAGAAALAKALAPIATPFGVAIGYHLMGRQQRKAHAENADRADARQKDDQAFRRELADLQHAQTRERSLEHLRATARQQYSPLRISETEADAMVPNAQSLRFFLTFPRHLVLRGEMTDRAWTEIYSDSLEARIQRFVQKHYDVLGPRPVFVYPRCVMNPDGLSGSAAVPFLQDGLRPQPTVYLESYRCGHGACDFAMSTWTDGASRAIHRSVGAVASYDLAVHGKKKQSMARALLFEQQLDRLSESEELRQLLARERARGASSPLYELLAGADRSAVRAELARAGMPRVPMDGPLPDPHSADVVEAAMGYMASAYQLLIAGLADLHFLARGTAPMLPRLIQQREFDLGEADSIEAVREVLSHYVWAAGMMAADTPQMAPEIYLVLAESFASVERTDWGNGFFPKAAEGFLLEAAKAASKLAQGPDIRTLDNLPALSARLRPGVVPPEWRERMARVLSRLGREALSKDLEAAQHATDANQDLWRLAGIALNKLGKESE